MSRETFLVSLDSLNQRVLALGSMVEKALQRACSALLDGNTAMAQRVVNDDVAIDTERYAIEQTCLLLTATQQPLAADLRLIVSIFSIVADLERMGDHAEGIARLIVRDREDMALLATPSTLRQLATDTQQQLHAALDCFSARDGGAARILQGNDDRIDALYQAALQELTAHMAEHPESADRATYLLWIAHNLERISDRAGNIANRVVFIVATP